MKKSLIAIMGAALLTSSVAFAGTNTNDNWFEGFFGKYYQDLNLNDAQKTQLSDIHQKHRLAEDKEIQAVLTAEQNKKWDELKASRKESYLRDNVDDVKKE
jgi:Spy/CpxP family protein refolding chaperone